MTAKVINCRQTEELATNFRQTGKAHKHTNEAISCRQAEEAINSRQAEEAQTEEAINCRQTGEAINCRQRKL